MRNSLSKHLLVTLGDDPGALNGVRFVTSFFSRPQDLRLTLLHTVPRAPRPGEALGDAALPVSCSAGAGAPGAHEAVERARDLLCASGFGAGILEAKIVFRQYARILDAILEGEKGLYDAVVLGSQAIGLLEQAYGSEVSRGVLEAHAGAPLWLCRDIDPARRGVLLCVDGSASSLAMADHVGFMLAAEPAHRVTLLTVAGPGQEPEQAREAARAALLDNGLDPARVDARRLEVRANEDIGPALLAEAGASGCAVVAMGRTGVGLRRAPGMFMGTAADHLFRLLRGAALWLCR